MTKVFKVVVEGGGRNLYYIRLRHGEYQVFHHLVNLIWDEENLIGTTDDAEEALELIQEHSDEDIDSVEAVED